MRYTIIHSDLFWHNDRAWRINSTKSGVRTDILKTLFGQLTALMSYHSQVFIYRFDLHISRHTDNNKVISDLNRRLFKRIKRHYDAKHIGYTWVREQEKAKQQHYHYALMLNGHKIRTPEILQAWIKEIWESLDGTCYWSAYHNIRRRDDHQKIHKVSHHLSYLAKPRGKGYRPAQTKDFGASRLKPKHTAGQSKKLLTAFNLLQVDEHLPQSSKNNKLNNT